MEFTISTIFLKPGTQVSYLVDGKVVVETVTEEVEVGLIAGLDGTTSIVEWAAAPGGEATAVEP